VESWTIPVSRDGGAEKVFLAVRTSDDARALAVITDEAQANDVVERDIAGAGVDVHEDGTATLT
jgi:acetyl-CoA C-acetyltransferase